MRHDAVIFSGDAGIIKIVSMWGQLPLSKHLENVYKVYHGNLGFGFVNYFKRTLGEFKYWIVI